MNDNPYTCPICNLPADYPSISGPGCVLCASSGFRYLWGRNTFPDGTITDTPIACFIPSWFWEKQTVTLPEIPLKPLNKSILAQFDAINANIDKACGITDTMIGMTSKKSSTII
jgi:hypothetical protein